MRLLCALISAAACSADSPAYPGDLPEVWTKRRGCSDRYLFVNTHTWGRHHNQFQSTLLGLILAQALNRTFVLGHFRHNHRWEDPRALYDYSEYARAGLCVIDDLREWSKRWFGGGERSVHCFGQQAHETPLGKVGRLSKKCTSNRSVPRHYPKADAWAIARRGLPALQASTARMVIVSGQFAFYARPGLRLMAAVWGRLRPSPDVAAEVQRFAAEKLSGEYAAVHLRSREGSCDKEIADGVADGSLKSIAPSTLDAMGKQCGMVPATFLATVGSTPQSVFLASDHQNMALEHRYAEVSAKQYSGKFHTREIGGLKGLSADYFLLRGGRWFVGASLSSVSQDVCFARLSTHPWKRACAGWDESYFSTTFARTPAYESMLPKGWF